MSGEGVLDALDTMANSFWCMFDQPEREINPVGSEDAYNFPECDYDRNPTNLYKQIEAKNWTSVNHFLLTGYWSGAFFADSTSPSEQACTWVTKYDPAIKRKKVMWTHLPIHAALSFGAPEGVVQLLVKLAPPTLRCADDQRMLPLHLAFRRGASDTTIALIMDVFPEGVAVRDFLGRTPAECSSEGPNPKRGSIIQTVLYYNQRAWEKKAAKAQDKQVQQVQKTLKERTEKMESMRAAFELIRDRDDQSRANFAKLNVELNKFKDWYDEKTPNDFFDNGGVLSAAFVRELTERLDRFHETAESLVVQQKKAKQELDKTLKELKTVWETKGWSNDMKIRSFNEARGRTAEVDQIQSDESSITSLITSSTTKKEETTADQAPEASKEIEKVASQISAKKSKEMKASTPAKIPSLFNADSALESKAKSKVSKAVSKASSKVKSIKSAKSKAESKAKEQKEKDEESKAKEQNEKPEEKAQEQQEKPSGSVVPHVVSAGSEPEELKQTISEMTSMDMSEDGGSKASSKKKPSLKLKLSLSMLSKQGSKKSVKGSVDGSKKASADDSKKGSIQGSVDGSKKGSVLGSVAGSKTESTVDGSRKSGLPPKDPSKQGKTEKKTVVKVRTGSVKVSPSM